MPEVMRDAGAPQGLSWSWELDFDALMAAIADAGPSLPDAAGVDPSGVDPSGTGSPRAGSSGGAAGRTVSAACTEPAHEAVLDDANAPQDDLDRSYGGFGA